LINKGILFRRIKYFLFKKAYQIFGRNSFSQAGEDMVIDFLLQTIKKTVPSYLELGVYDPRNGSNTYKFYVRGAKGVLVEADSTLIADIKNQRPNDKVLHMGVGLKDETEALFFVFDEPSISTFDKEEAYHRQSKGLYKIIREDRVPLKSLNRILEEDCNGLPDILSIDIEGLDYDVLMSWDAEKFPVPIVIAETCLYSQNHIKGKDERITPMMISKRYFVYADTYINTIYVHENWFKSIS
jgi:FkbM family methyltransferase